jgi:exo-beta-1,3-glucanase (GH17 family)
MRYRSLLSGVVPRALIVTVVLGAGGARSEGVALHNAPAYQQAPQDLIAGETMGLAYSGFRLGQHPDKGEGALNPSRSEMSEDLDIILAHGVRLIRLYDTGENSAEVLSIIRERQLPIRVLLGIWLRAEISNHEGCEWLEEPIPALELTANRQMNDRETQRAIALAGAHGDIIAAVNVGNEALADWNDHMVSVDRVIEQVRRVKQAIEQPVTVADNYEWWIRDGAALAAELDFIGVHTYPMWEDKSIDEALAYTIENIEAVHAALSGSPIAILEADWATVATEYPDSASEENQRRYYQQMKRWAQSSNTTVLFFEAFDEPWKGDAQALSGAEKHWGLFNVDRTPGRSISWSTLASIPRGCTERFTTAPTISSTSNSARAVLRSRGSTVSSIFTASSGPPRASPFSPMAAPIFTTSTTALAGNPGLLITPTISY